MSLPVSILNEYSGEDEGLRFVLARILGELNRQELLISGGTNDLGEETAGNPTSDGGEGTAVNYLTEADLAAYLANNGFTAGATTGTLLSISTSSSNSITVNSSATKLMLFGTFASEVIFSGSRFAWASGSYSAYYEPSTAILITRFMYSGLCNSTAGTDEIDALNHSAGSASLTLTSSAQTIFSVKSDASGGAQTFGALVSGSTLTLGWTTALGSRSSQFTALQFN